MAATSLRYKLDKPPKYEYEETGAGVWKTFVFEDGCRFREYTSHFHIGDLPWVSVVSGINPETGKMAVARGVFAVGQKSKGVFTVGQFTSGYFSFGQFVTARIMGIGQFCAAPLAIGQISIALAAITQLGIVGTGIMQSGVTFFGAVGIGLLDLSRFF